jgi:putative SOS response-associated peptidase YedK
MCGRYLLFDEAQNVELWDIINEINDRLKDNPEAPEMKTGEIFPTDNAPILVSRGGRQSAHIGKWGFPNFSRPGVIINAKAETLEERPMFRRSFYERRCLVPASGYFEWKRDGANKTKYVIHTGRPLLYMAGLYGVYRDKKDRPYTGFVVITTGPSAVVSQIHNRMPAILQPDKIDQWLEADEPGTLYGLLTPYDGVIAQTA